MYAFALVVEETLVAVWDVGLLTGSSTERGNEDAGGVSTIQSVVLPYFFTLKSSNG